MQRAFKCIETVAESGTLLQLLSNNGLYGRARARSAGLRTSRYPAYEKFTRRCRSAFQVDANVDEYNELELRCRK